MKFELMAKQPISMEKAMKWAKLEEEKSAALHKNVKGTSARPVSSLLSHGAGGSISFSKSTSQMSSSGSNPTRRLSAQEVGNGERRDYVSIVTRST